ncbi:MAG: hypothetical protein WAM30_00345, partial [Candidatus Dormiibacterota bacterium]
MAQSGRRIVVVGGGSVTWTPRLMCDFLLAPDLADSTFVLFDVDGEAAQLATAFCSALARSLGVGATFLPSTERERALEGADAVVVAVAVGGLDAMAHDLEIPEQHRIYHTVGDTAGPGGWSRLLRNFDAFCELGHAIDQLAPQAIVLNYTNPLAMLTSVLARTTKAPVVGLCHGVYESRDFLASVYGTPKDAVSMRYGGLNHFFWVPEAKVGGVDAVADLRSRLATQTLDELEPARAADPLGFHSDRAVATELFRLTGVLPYIGDRHTCEFLPWYLTDPARMARYRLQRTSIEQRWARRRELTDEVRRVTADGIPSEWAHASGEAAAEIVRAYTGGGDFVDIGNLPNEGQIENLPRGVPVETAVRFDQNGVAPFAFGSLPDPVVPLVEPVARA